MTTDARTVPAEALSGCEVWLVNAVHGIRPVAAWSGGELQAGAATRAEGWQRELDAQRAKLA